MNKHLRAVEDFKYLEAAYNRAKQSIQTHVTAIVEDNELSIAVRFRVWAKYARKEWRSWIIKPYTIFQGKKRASFPLMGQYVEDHPDYFDRHRKYNYEDMLEMMGDNLEYEDGETDAEYWIRRNRYEDEIKAELMATNFGGFTYDW